MKRDSRHGRVPGREIRLSFATMNTSAVALALIVCLLAPRVVRACVDEEGCDRGQECVDHHCHWPERIESWHVGEPIPDGYHVEEVHRDGLIGGGAFVLCIATVLLVVGASEVSEKKSGGTINTGFGLLLAGVGFGLLIPGIATHEVLERNDVHANEPRAFGATYAFRF